MDFFEHQERARRKSFRLVLYYILAVAAIVVSVYLVALLVFYFEAAEQSPVGLPGFRWWNPSLFSVVSTITLSIILFGSLYKIWALSSGGPAVAGLLGGLPIDPNTTDADQRRVLNVVEEMAIASGIPVPPVFLLEEKGINAFAAGYSPTDAVIGVTEGCIKNLKRDELQGVIAHEFSHIFNGDMRLNIRLMGILHGILVIGMIGELILRGALNSSSRSSRHSDKEGKGGSGVLALLFFGFMTMVIGYTGVLFGKLIKSAVSRQREFLADASAVQFTRNPAGIAEALKRIGGLSSGSRIKNGHAEEASHFFFANGVAWSFEGLFSTHPPLEERIRRIDPSFEGSFKSQELPGSQESPFYDQWDMGDSPASSFSSYPQPTGAPHPPSVVKITPEAILAGVGDITPETFAYAKVLRDSIPPILLDAVRDPFSARALVCGMMLDWKDGAVRTRQMDVMRTQCDPLIIRDLVRIYPEFQKLRPEHRLPLLELSAPALQMCSEKQFAAFHETVVNLIHTDQRISVFEFSVQHVLLKAVARKFKPVEGKRYKYTNLAQVIDPLSILLSTLAYTGADSDESARTAFEAGQGKVGDTRGALRFVDRNRLGLETFDKAMGELNQVIPKWKSRIVEGAAACVIVDGQISINEGELLRALASALECPMPPFFPGMEVRPDQVPQRAP